MSRLRLIIGAAALAATGVLVIFQVVSAEPAPSELSSRAIEPRDDFGPPSSWAPTTTTTTTTEAPTTTTAPPPPPPPAQASTRRSKTTPAPTPAPAPAPAPSVEADPGAESQLLSYINSERSKRGIAGVTMNGAARGVSQSWSRYMATHALAHNPNYRQQLRDAGVNWRVVGENVGQGQSTSQVHGLFMSSGTHRANILNPEYSHVGIGVASANGDLYITIDFVGY